MAVTLGTTNITFNDSTAQGTAWAGIGGQVFNSSGTFTIPTGVTKIRATVIGGSQGVPLDSPRTWNQNGNGGGSSSISSGSQSISTVTGAGGSGQGQAHASYSDYSVTFPAPMGGAIGSGGDCNWRTSGLFPNGAPASGNSNGLGNAGGIAVKYLTGLTPGLTISVTIGGGGGGQAWGGWAGFWGTGGGNSGQVIFEW